jgi:hypothetical protein
LVLLILVLIVIFGPRHFKPDTASAQAAPEQSVQLDSALANPSELKQSIETELAQQQQAREERMQQQMDDNR